MTFRIRLQIKLKILNLIFHERCKYYHVFSYICLVNDSINYPLLTVKQSLEMEIPPFFLSLSYE